jgi:hypothetical protein
MTAQPSIPPTPTIVEYLGTMLVRLVMGIGSRASWSNISPKVVQLISDRFRQNKLRIERIVAQIRAGTYVFRHRTAQPRAPASPDAKRPAPPPSPLPQKFGWLLPLIPVRPEEYWHANAARGHLETLLNDPEMVALVAAAPVSLGRPLRSLCWMFGLRPPPHLAPPRRRPPRADAPPPEPPPATTAEAAPQAPPAPVPPAPSPAQSPPRLAGTAPATLACGPPNPA